MAEQQAARDVIASTESVTSEAPSHAPYANHGRTRAAWVLVVGVVLGATVVGVGLYASLGWLMALGGGIALVGIGASVALRALGYGQPLSGGKAQGPGQTFSQP